MRQVSLLIGLLLFLSTAIYAQNPNSAYRPDDQDWHQVAQKSSRFSLMGRQSILSQAIAWDKSSIESKQNMLNNAPIWPDYETIKAQFEFIKNNHYLIDPIDSTIKRTIPWRYPVDFCFERAAAAISLFNTGSLARPAKVFAFGNLKLLSPYAPAERDFLSFWYHVAPVVRDGKTNTLYVLDPSLNYEAPLPLENWLKQLVELSPHQSISVNICNGHGSVPFDICEQNSEPSFAADVVLRLPGEWDHLQAKGINSQQALTSVNTNNFQGARVYGAVIIAGLKDYTALKDNLLIEFKSTSDANWHTLLNLTKIIDKINHYEYFSHHPKITIGNIFGKESRDANCQCTYYDCACALPDKIDKIDLRITLNNTTLEQCTYQYPNKNAINYQYDGPEIDYFLHVTDGNIETTSINGKIDGCTSTLNRG